MAEESVTRPEELAQKDVATAVSKTRRLLPEAFSRPIALLIACIIPQAVLQLLNLRAYLLISGDMTPEQRSTAGLIFGFGILIIVFVAALAVTYKVIGRPVALPFCGALFVACAGYLFATTSKLEGLIPQAAAVWIVPAGQLLYYQFMLVTPALFYAVARLGCFENDRKPLFDGLISLAVAASVPLGAFLFFEAFRYVGDESTFIIIIFGGAAVMIGALSRTALIAYRAAASRCPWLLFVLTFLVALACPIGGLILNLHIPFPADFQTTSVYVMAALNGVALLMPNFASRRLHRLVWLTQCALFPFTLYFFLLFLPWMPLSVPLIIIIGSGFLVLTPTLLFLVHGQRLFDGYAAEIRDEPSWKPALMACAALLVIPLLLTGEAFMDRVVLRGALDYFYSPNYLTERYDGSRMALDRSLRRLRDFKAGVQLPFLSEYYNWIVFDNLVLTDAKMQEIHRAVFGTDLEPAGSSMFDMQSGTRGGRTWSESTLAPAPSTKDVAISNIQQHTAAEGSCLRTVLQVELTNKSSNSPVEFAGSITVPDGVLVSGYKLKVGTEMVPGRIFEKKTAQWVYRQIRDQTRRDPGILSYTGPNALELRVYPFAEKETRTLELELLSAPGENATVQLDGRSVSLGATSPQPASANWLAGFPDGGAALGIVPNALPQARRRPYLHFIIERSLNSHLDEAAALSLMQQAARRYPEAIDCMITAANYQFYEIAPEPVPVASLNAATLTGKLPPLEGGFLYSRAIKRALLEYDAKANQPGDHAWSDRYPIIVVLRGSDAASPVDGDLAQFRRIAPDTDAIQWRAGKNEPQEIPFGVRSEKVALLKIDDAEEPCAINTSKLQIVFFDPASTNKAVVNVYDEGTKTFREIPGVAPIPPESRFSSGMAAQRDEWQLVAHPETDMQQLAAIVSLSRETGVLSYSTSYMVVEADSQWKIAQRKENQKLRNSSALELQEQSIPEPGSIALLIAGALAPILWRVIKVAKRSG